MSLNSDKRYIPGAGLNWSSTRKGHEHKRRREEKSGLEGGPDAMRLRQKHTSVPKHNKQDYHPTRDHPYFSTLYPEDLAGGNSSLEGGLDMLKKGRIGLNIHEPFRKTDEEAEVREEIRKAEGKLAAWGPRGMQRVKELKETYAAQNRFFEASQQSPRATKESVVDWLDSETVHAKYPMGKHWGHDKDRDSIRESIMGMPGYQIGLEYNRSHPGFIHKGALRTRLHSVESVLSEQFSWAIMLLMDEGKFSSDVLYPPDKSFPEGHRFGARGRMVVASALAHAVPYVWTNEVFTTVVKNKLPRHIVDMHLPYPDVWFTFQNGLTMEHAAGAGPDCKPGHADGFMLMETGQHITFALVGTEDEPAPDMGGMGRPFCYMGAIPQGKIFPDDWKDYPWHRHTVGYLLSCLSFVNSPYGTVEKRSLERHARRRVGIQGPGPESTQPRFIILRQPVVKSDEEHQSITVDWKCRWTVRGHHRNQYLPSTQGHRLIWIPSHVKGPADKPLKLMKNAFKVVR